MAKKVIRKPVDWEAIEGPYRAGIESIRAIGRRFSVAAPSICQHAEAHGWTRDLKAKIRAKAADKVNANALGPNGGPNSPEGVLRTTAIVDANADLLAEVQLEQRTDIRAHRKFLSSLLTRLQGPEGAELPLPVQIDSAKKLGEATVKAIDTERIVFGIEDRISDDSKWDKALDAALNA